MYLSGTVIDFQDGLNGKGFTFQNPQAKRSCGCGSSFST
jgi:iron-sulfur cluster assembly protein